MNAIKITAHDNDALSFRWRDALITVCSWGRAVVSMDSPGRGRVDATVFVKLHPLSLKVDAPRGASHFEAEIGEELIRFDDLQDALRAVIADLRTF